MNIVDTSFKFRSMNTEILLIISIGNKIYTEAIKKDVILNSLARSAIVKRFA